MRIESDTSAPGSAFSQLLRDFQAGGISYGDFIARINQQLAAGAVPAELQKILLRREVVEPLPVYAHDAVMSLLGTSPPAPSRDAPDATARTAVKPAVSAEAATIILDDGDDAAAPAALDLPPAAWAPGDVLDGRFELIEMIGEGGMSRVFKAIDSRLTDGGSADRYVAVKVFTRPFADDLESFESLQREVAKLSGLTHPHIVRTFACERDGSAVFMTMEYLTGQSLYARLHGGAATASGNVSGNASGNASATATAGVTAPAAGSGLPRDEAQSIVAAVADALAFAHGHDVVHGDLKPGNVIVTGAGEIKVIDFGVSTWVARPKTALERREAAQSKPPSAVTPKYASPQLMARHKPEITDDVYALACLTYELFTGHHPFDDGTGAHALRFPPPARAQLSSMQYAAVLRGLQFERRNRTPTIAQFVAEFSALEPRARRGTWALWLGAALIVAAVGWYFGHPLARTEPPPQTGVPPPAPAPAQTLAQTQPQAPLPAPASAASAGSVLSDCPSCPSMTVLPTGRFQQGSAGADAGALPFERPQHAVSIGNPIAMSTNAVTVGEFGAFIAATGRKMRGCDVYDGKWLYRRTAGWNDPGFPQTERHPVTCTSWNDAAAYAQWLSAKTGHRYRLPSASEWEYAARAGGAAARPWDSSGTGACADANVADRSAERRYPGWEVFGCDDGYVNTAPVGSFKANAFGLNDMLGNVFQWTEDCWHGDYAGAPADGSPWMDGDCGERELRGGSWFSSPAYVRATYRNHFAANYRTSSVGFRLVRDLGP